MTAFVDIPNPDPIRCTLSEVVSISAATNGRVVIEFALGAESIALSLDAESCERLMHGVPAMLHDAQNFARLHTPN